MTSVNCRYSTPCAPPTQCGPRRSAICEWAPLFHSMGMIKTPWFAWHIPAWITDKRALKHAPTQLAADFLSVLLNPELIHARKRLRILGLKDMPAREVVHGPVVGKACAVLRGDGGVEAESQKFHTQCREAIA